MRTTNDTKNKKNVGAPAHRCPNRGITLIALIITIVLNCSCLAMVVRKSHNNKKIKIEKIRNLLYNRLCNQKLQKYYIGGFVYDK